MVNRYIPKQGDIIFLNFNPTLGHEQKGKRPAIVVSNDIFNKNTHMIIVCPITSNEKDYPTHYLLEDTKKVHGTVLCEHIRSIDFDARNVNFIEKASDNDLLNVITLMNACIEN